VAWYSHEKTSIVTGDPGEWSSVQLIAECHTTEADARVMSASRELLEALRLCKVELQYWMPDHGQDIAAQKAISKATSANAKAKGETA
jgi:hypothetical protein